MKLKIFFARDDHPSDPRVQLNADMKKTDPAGNPWTCNSLFLDFLNTPQAKNYELKRWKLRRDSDKWNGFANEKSPELNDGDEVTFYGARKPDA
jgi:hypothetical protein